MLLPCVYKPGFYSMVPGVPPGARFGEWSCSSEGLFLLKTLSSPWRTAMLLRPHFPTTRA